MNQKARILLKEGRLVTAGSSSMCGVDLRPEETYLITGKVVAGQASINLCNYITPWAHLSVRQKKGFRLLYRQGCSCEVRRAEMYYPVYGLNLARIMETHLFQYNFIHFIQSKYMWKFSNFLMTSFRDDVFLQ
jgi:hypothetical protein